MIIARAARIQAETTNNIQSDYVYYWLSVWRNEPNLSPPLPSAAPRADSVHPRACPQLMHLMSLTGKAIAAQQAFLTDGRMISAIKSPLGRDQVSGDDSHRPYRCGLRGHRIRAARGFGAVAHAA
jgi:hypothetical protein